MINSGAYPRVERKEMGKQNVYRRVKHVNKDYSEEVPYIKDVKDFIDKHPYGKKDRFLIVSRSEPAAVKSAKYICDRYSKSSIVPEEEEELEFDFEFDDEEYADFASIDLIDLSKVRIPDIIPGNAYLSILMEEANGDNVMYEGLNDDKDIDNKVDAILADTRVRKFIWILPERLREPWVTALRMEKGYEAVIIKDIPDGYYEDVFDKLLRSAGMRLGEGLTPANAVGRIRKLRGKDFTEEDLEWAVGQAIDAASQRGIRELTAEDLNLEGVSEESAEAKLMRMPGLDNIKETVTEFTSLLLEKSRNRSLKDMHSNMIFYGNPGTGKSTCAELLADIMADKGISNTAFVKASRADVIGKYVGHTASRVSGLFDKARGGILFVDEAGFFLNESSGGYLKEAVKEFVRFMELYPDVTVIFSMYEKEAAAFLKLDEGISSRISRMVAFEDYSVKELKDIFVHMIAEKGYAPGRGASEQALKYVEEQKNGRNFGNAREVRKLVESAIVAHSVRIHSGISPAGAADTISAADVKKGMERLRRMPENRRNFGFEYAQAAVMPLY